MDYHYQLMNHSVDAKPATFRFDVPRVTVTVTRGRPPWWRSGLRRLRDAAKLINAIYQITEKAPKIIENVREFIGSLVDQMFLARPRRRRKRA